MINGLSVGGGQQQAAANTKAKSSGAAITLHFTYNNNNSSNSNNISSRSNNKNYNNQNHISGHKMDHQMNNNQKESLSTKVLKIIESIRGGGGEAAEAATGKTATIAGTPKAVEDATGGSVGGGVASLNLLPMPIRRTSLLHQAISSTSAITKEKERPQQKTAKPPALALPLLSLTPQKQQPEPHQGHQPQRTEDQEHAFRLVEDVHNYAKLQDYSEDDGEDLLDDDEDNDDDDDDEEEQQMTVPMRVQQEVTRIQLEDTEEHVDVVTVPQQELVQQKLQLEPTAVGSPNNETGDRRPEHHARRPMNAFLIFCKRHRAIVKERYKSLENRAITKILGDWWAALDEQEKHCFTDLAQQNKDAFFNANPNFKWYKLPAPPLRTLATRPGNAATPAIGGHLTDENPQNTQQQVQLQWERNELHAAPMTASLSAAKLLRGNFFKLADETQMGELSALLQAQVQEKACELQQVLSETSQFLSTHMPGGTKRPISQDSNSSNSSEEDVGGLGSSPCKKAKSSRSCKGKIYQELVNSGQLAAVAKKSKSRLNSGGQGAGFFGDAAVDAASPHSQAVRQQMDSLEVATSTSCKHPRSVSESSSSGGGGFDLEEKIKELTALSLDAYLQRKRSTKKKKKFTAGKKQRNSNSTSAGGAACGGGPATGAAGAGKAAANELVRKEAQRQAAVVGSQKRKARKESITRRDVSAIEQEVASILPLTINGCYYFDQTASPDVEAKAANNSSLTLSTTSTSLSSSSSASPPLSSASSSSSSSSSSSQAAFDVTSTSDLLILAEVAANRTELTKSN
ncbi:uncharacterized protein bbx [Drosophila pseudoobscura]|uniref:Uncharacterized protein bbx n=2 Tax=pseudoobscura subgroup TaxID=32358 RepID=A0A6I8VGP4_DROPS|nr:uncharacterized protein LOC4815857 [Drosophila pseudoobscura]XP_015040970.2 uncharacterized protein LOC4815857 [Drosophila pseudoobscura]XP_015040971.2 uncharacterized protein LOC4815857 [Drosophila pseudoobscura]XP_015040972.2 uncharacterized protein LOC4815857 [Drosophila pseudoobscura]XP_015040973.2 uncharacterized protein LOC4815857 [Drosophila pseudoobscura]